jgi:hypothetical protein
MASTSRPHVLEAQGQRRGWTLVLNPDGTTTAWNKDKTWTRPKSSTELREGRDGGLTSYPGGYSARRAEAVRARAAQPAGASAPATAMTRPDSASRTSSPGT